MTYYNQTKDVDRVCANKTCRKAFKARSADVKRGWARYCCKSCKAVVQTRRTGRGAPRTDFYTNLFELGCK